MTGGPTYTFSAAPAITSSEKKLRKTQKNRYGHHRRQPSDGEEDPTDGQGSLTYSANSSVVSGGSMAGESTDSSFADIMRVLDMQDDNEELRAILKKEGVSSAGELKEKQRAKMTSGGVSVASSLQYSTDGESHLDGSQLLQTIAGQPSDSYGFDGGGLSKGVKEEPIKTGDTDILFAPAEPANMKKKKKKRQEQEHGHNRDSIDGTPKAKNNKTFSSSSSYQDNQFDDSPSPSIDTPTKSPPTGSDNMKPIGLDNTTPPPLPPSTNKGYEMEEDDEDIWYAKWWMSCFPDAFKNLMPKR